MKSERKTNFYDLFSFNIYEFIENFKPLKQIKKNRIIKRSIKQIWSWFLIEHSTRKSLTPKSECLKLHSWFQLSQCSSHLRRTICEWFAFLFRWNRTLWLEWIKQILSTESVLINWWCYSFSNAKKTQNEWKKKRKINAYPQKSKLNSFVCRLWRWKLWILMINRTH